MAFHSRNAPARNRRSARNDKESILGLSGWLFADLLLAIAVMFLVVEARGTSGPETTDPPPTIPTTTTTTLVPSDAGNRLIADPEFQLFVEVKGGATSQSRPSFKRRLEKAQVEMGQSKRERSTWAQLQRDNYRVGLIMWFASSTNGSKKSAEDHLASAIEFFVNKGLIIEKEQWGDRPPKYSDFPHIANYQDLELDKPGRRSDLKFRIFLFKVVE